MIVETAVSSINRKYSSSDQILALALALVTVSRRMKGQRNVSINKENDISFYFNNKSILNIQFSLSSDYFDEYFAYLIIFTPSSLLLSSLQLP